MSQRAIVIIPARGGSKSIPKKNIVPFCGKPLLSWSIIQAKDAILVDEVYVSTDDKEIATVARAYGAKVIDRPAEISGDTATSESALAHALQEITPAPDYVVFLQATSPVRESKDIDNAIRKIKAEDADSLFSGAQLHDFGVWKVDGEKRESITYDYQKRGRRQDATRVGYYVENGSMYVFTPNTLSRLNNRLGGKIVISEMELWKSFEIDEPDDITFCELIFKAKGLHTQ